ncbi:TetR family transcriptional regulator [Aurantiacibacter flavus]|uniref:TetR family transcriptional regulator n=1 Tax=Aurantiacibacter flavus TaxID=3145232 RepID=A0ABV0D1I9_9SPHN
MVKHAHASEDKEKRRNAILGAALSLFLKDTRRLPSAAAIAAKAGLAKGTVYLYFTSKEQIFAALLSREWDAFLATLRRSFAEEPGHPSRAVDRFVDNFVDFLASRTYFLRLDSLGYGLLEANLSPAEFRDFKRSFATSLNRTSAEVDKALALEAGDGLRLLLRSYALARGLFQTLDFPAHILNDSQPEDHPLTGFDFETELRAALVEYWRGALASPPRSPRRRK